MKKNVLQVLKEDYEKKLSPELKDNSAGKEQIIAEALASITRKLCFKYGQAEGEIKAKKVIIEVLVYHLEVTTTCESLRLSYKGKDEDLYNQLVHEGYIEILETVYDRKINSNGYLLDGKEIPIKGNLVGYFSLAVKGALSDYIRNMNDVNLTLKQKKIKEIIREFEQISDEKTSDNEIDAKVFAYFDDIKTSTGKGYKVSIQNIEEVRAVSKMRYFSEPLGADGNGTFADTLSKENVRGYIVEEDYEEYQNQDILGAIFQELAFRVEKSHEEFLKAGKGKKINDVKKDIIELYIKKFYTNTIDENGINSYLDIAKKYGISESAVSQQKKTLDEMLADWLKEINIEYDSECIDYLYKRYEKRKKDK